MAARIWAGVDVAGEAVGVGEEIAFERGGVGREIGDEVGLAAFGGEEVVAGAEAGGLDRLGDVEDVVALGDGEGDGVDIAADHARIDFRGGGGVVEAVLAGDELAALDGTEESERRSGCG